MYATQDAAMRRTAFFSYFGRHISAVLAVIYAVCLSGCLNYHEKHFILTIAHTNDIHSRLEPSALNFYCNDIETSARVGGFPRLMTKLNHLRASRDNVLYLNAGDIFEGAYFKQRSGLEVLELLNMMQLDAHCPGNHEFDRGPQVLADFIERANFPVLCANIDVEQEACLRGKIKPYVIKSYGPERVGIAGLTTALTADISRPGESVHFYDAFLSARRAVDDLTRQGIHKIIILSHEGFREDIALAEKVPGIDIIVGGHSHTLLGDFNALGIASDGAYPHAVKNAFGETVLIVQAWEWAKVLGVLDVEFDELGRVAGYAGSPQFLAGPDFKQKNALGSWSAVDNETREALLSKIAKNSLMEITEEDPAALHRLTCYNSALTKNAGKAISFAAEDLLHVRIPGARSTAGNVLSEGSHVACLAAESMLWQVRKAGLDARIALLNAGAVRCDIPQGEVTAGQIYDVLPFGNTLVIVEMSGSEVAATLEHGVAAAISRSDQEGAFPYAAGVCYTADASKPEGAYITGIDVQNSDGSWEPLLGEEIYPVVVSSFIARGGDGYDAVSRSGRYRFDTGFVDAEAFIDYAESRGTLTRKPEPGIELYGFLFRQ